MARYELPGRCRVASVWERAGWRTKRQTIACQKTRKTCQKLTDFRGEIEKNSGKITKNHGAVGHDRNHRQNEENGWKIDDSREPAGYEVSRIDRNEGQLTVKCSQVIVRRYGVQLNFRLRTQGRGQGMRAH